VVAGGVEEGDADFIEAGAEAFDRQFRYAERLEDIGCP
jgi:hypothetical protein